MKKILSLFFAILSLFAFASCKHSDNNGTQKKEKLVWVLSDYDIEPNISEPALKTVDVSDYDFDMYKKTASLYMEKGLGIDIEFKKVIVPEQSVSPVNTLEYLIDKGYQVDIISYSGQKLSYLLDLTEYFKTEEGANVRNNISERVWQGLGYTDGGQYFVPKIKRLQGRRNAYVIDNENLKTADLKIDDLQTDMEQLTPIFEKAAGGGFSCYNIGAAMYSSVVFPVYTPVDVDFVFPFLAIDKRESEPLIENIYKNEECIKKLKLLLGWKNQGFIYDSDKESLILDSTYQEKDWYDDEKIVLPLGESYAESNIRNKSLAICKKSKYADFAFKAIAMSVTDPEISMAVNPYQVNIVAPEDEIKSFDSFGFYPDFRPVKLEYENCIEIIKNRFTDKYSENGKKLTTYGDPWKGEMENLDTGIEELNQELMQAGLDKILNELDRQLTEFYKNNK